MARYDARGKNAEPGPVIVRVTEMPVEVTRGGFLMIDLALLIAGQEKPIKKGFFPNQLSGMFQALGFEEVEPGIFDGDIKKAFGRSFQAELYYEDYDKGDGTKGKARRLRNFTKAPVNPDGAQSPEDVAWEE
jgi:hypothetical protein